MKNYIKTLSRDKRREFCASDELFEDAIAKFGEGARVINPCYTDYGGTLDDRACIEYFKETEPGLCVWEHTSWNGQNAICLMEYPNLDALFDEVSDKYYEIENEMIANDVDDFCMEHSCSHLRQEVEGWICNHSCSLATMIDYNVRDLEEYIAPMAAESMHHTVKRIIVDNFIEDFRKEMILLERKRIIDTAYHPEREEVYAEADKIVDRLIENAVMR